MSVGNILGASRAEIDGFMIENAFVETNDYRALTTTDDFNFVVGRRGVGKTALYRKIKKYYSDNGKVIFLSFAPEEHSNLILRSFIEELTTDYNMGRAIFRVAWKINLLLEISLKIKSHWKAERSDDYSFLINYLANNKSIITDNCFDRLYSILRRVQSEVDSPLQLPGKIASIFELNKLEDAVKNLLTYLHLKTIIIFDDLDEGWIPDTDSASVLGGLALAAADFRDHESGIQTLLFIRDNIFRRLASIDPDYSRHIEGNTIRIHWNFESLLHLITERIRIHLGMTETENDIKVWNRFAFKNLKNREGFEYCLHFTLFRPRDLLVLLNQSYMNATRSGRQEIIEEDIDATSRQISIDRLNDLKNEYSQVFPGLGLIVDFFKDQSPFIEYGNCIQLLNSAIDDNTYSEKDARDLALLGSGSELFKALYSVGFLGMEDKTKKSLTFCHDGALYDLIDIDSSDKIVIHPCFWKALNIQDQVIEESILIDIYDDYDTRRNIDTNDLRTKMLGQLVSDLPKVPNGHEGSKDFEDWVFRVIKILFSGILHNPELKPNKNSVNRRDIVATNMAERGFWKRILDDYKSRQVIFEVKNYENVDLDDYRQVLSYSGKDYGKFVIIVNRSQFEELSEQEKAWIQEFYHDHDVLIFKMPSSLLSRSVRKLRNPRRKDYWERAFSKRLDLYVRSYIPIKSGLKKK